MAARNWMLVQVDGLPSELLKSAPTLDRGASAALAQRLFPEETLEAMADASLDQAHPPNDVLLVGCYPGLAILAAKEFSADRPSQLDRRFLDTAPGGTVYLHAMHSGVDWFAYAVWRNGELQRALSLSPDGGLQDDVGEPLPFEQPFWQGQHPPAKVVDEFDDDEEDDEPYPLPFQPLALGETALKTSSATSSKARRRLCKWTRPHWCCCASSAESGPRLGPANPGGSACWAVGE